MIRRLIVVLFFLMLLLVSCSLNSEDSSQIKVKEFNIIVDKSLIDSIYTDFSKDIYIPIQFVNKGDTSFAKMRLRGDSSRKYGKKSLKIIFPKGEVPKGENRKINLNSEWTDKSYIRQYMSSLLLNKSGVPTFNVNFVSLSVNGKFWGLYLQAQNMDKTFLKENNLDHKANMYKATKDGACLSHFDNIKDKWEKKSNKKDNWDDLQILINQLDTVSVSEYQSFLKEKFEYDKLITIIAMNMLIQNGSTYYHNYYMYHDINGNNKWQMFSWDMDKSMSFYNWKPYKYHETSSNWESDNPLVEKCFLNNETRKDIRKKVQNLSETIFTPTFTHPIIEVLEDILEPFVDQDQTDQIKKVSKWKRNLNVEKKFVENQVQNILYQLDSFPTPFALERIKSDHYKKIGLHWSSSKSFKPITYTLLYGKHFLLENETTQRIEGITDTLITLKNLSPGTYYWRVYASDGDHVVEGYNTKNRFVITDNYKELRKHGKNTVLNSEQPYLLKSKFILNKGESLSANPGVVLYIGQEAEIINNGGTIYFQGDKNSKIKVYSMSNVHKKICMDKNSNNVFKSVDFANSVFDVEKLEIKFVNQ